MAQLTCPKCNSTHTFTSKEVTQIYHRCLICHNEWAESKLCPQCEANQDNYMEMILHEDDGGTLFSWTWRSP